jgi:hypothetical protein
MPLADLKPRKGNHHENEIRIEGRIRAFHRCRWLISNQGKETIMKTKSGLKAGDGPFIDELG